jgi:hypothetical protein
MLHDLKHLADRHELEPDDLRQAARILLERQFLFSQRKKDQDAYRLIRNHFDYFQNLFDALGWTLERDDDFAFLGIVPMETESFARLKLVETLLILCLRLLYEEGVEHFEVNEGSVYVEMENVLNRYEAQTRRVRPNRGNALELFRSFKRFGIIELGEPDSGHLPQIRILPSIRKVTDRNVLARLQAYLPEEADSQDNDA